MGCREIGDVPECDVTRYGMTVTNSNLDCLHGWMDILCPGRLSYSESEDVGEQIYGTVKSVSPCLGGCYATRRNHPQAQEYY